MLSYYDCCSCVYVCASSLVCLVVVYVSSYYDCCSCVCVRVCLLIERVGGRYFVFSYYACCSCVCVCFVLGLFCVRVL